MQYLRVNTVLWISASFQRRSHAVQYSCSQLPYNFPPEIKSTTNFVTGNIAQMFNICKSPPQGTKYRTITLQVDRKGQPYYTRGDAVHRVCGGVVYSRVDPCGQPISIKLRKEEVKRSKEKLASGERILQKKDHVRSLTERSR